MKNILIHDNQAVNNFSNRKTEEIVNHAKVNFIRNRISLGRFLTVYLVFVNNVIF